MSRKLNNWLDAYMEYTAETESAPIFHKWVGISMIAAVLRKKTWLNFGRLRMYPNLYVVLVAEPGVARKTQAISYGTRLINEISGIKISSDAITKEALIEEIIGAEYDEPMRDGSIFKHSSISVISREFESFIGQKKENTKMVVFLTDMFDVEELPWKYRTRNKGSEVAPAVFFNLLAATTPDSLASSLPPSAIGGGLTTRMIFVWASGMTNKVPIPELSERVLKLKDLLIHDLSVISRITDGYDFSASCRDEWIRWYNNYDQLSARRLCKDTAFNGWYSRKPMFILKLALILTASRTNSQSIAWSQFEEAISLIEEVESLMGRTFSSIGRSDITVDVDLVMSIVRRHKIITEKQLIQMVWRDIDSKKFDNVIMTACRSGDVERIYKLPNGDKGIWYAWRGSSDN